MDKPTDSTVEEDDMEEGSPAEEKAETPDEEMKEDGGDGMEAKVPEAFQKEAMALVSSCQTMACLDFLSSEVSEMRQKMMSSQKKSGLNTDEFTAQEMPE